MHVCACVSMHAKWQEAFPGTTLPERYSTTPQLLCFWVMWLGIPMQDKEISRLNNVYTNIMKSAGITYIGEEEEKRKGKTDFYRAQPPTHMHTAQFSCTPRHTRRALAPIPTLVFTPPLPCGPSPKRAEAAWWTAIPWRFIKWTAALGG